MSLQEIDTDTIEDLLMVNVPDIPTDDDYSKILTQYFKYKDKEDKYKELKEEYKERIADYLHKNNLSSKEVITESEKYKLAYEERSYSKVDYEYLYHVLKNYETLVMCVKSSGDNMKIPSELIEDGLNVNETYNKIVTKTPSTSLVIRKSKAKTKKEKSEKLSKVPSIGIVKTKPSNYEIPNCELS